MYISDKKILCHCNKEMTLEVEEDTYFKCPDGHRISYYGAVGREMCRAHQPINVYVNDEQV